jgi:hypothetical protein
MTKIISCRYHSTLAETLTGEALDMSDQREETPGEDQESNPAKSIVDFVRSRLGVTLLSCTAIFGLFFGLVSFLSDTAQIFSVIDTQPQSLVAIALLALAMACVPAFFFLKIEKTRKNTAIFVALLTGLLVSTIIAWPGSRKLSEWAADVNGVCVEEFQRARSSIKEMESAGYDLIEAATPFQAKPNESIESLFAAVDDPMRRAFSASAGISDQHGSTLRRITSLRLPVADFERDKAVSWIDEYKEYADNFHNLYESLAGYATSDSVKDKTGFFTDSMSYLIVLQTKKNDVVARGKSIHVESCF